MLLFLRRINDFRYIPENETVGDILGWNKPEATKIFTNYKNTEKALRQILLASKDKLYVRSLHHKYIGYGKITTQALFDNLYSTYANISASALQDNEKRLRDPYDINQPFKTLIATVSDRASVAALTAINSTLTTDCTDNHSQILIALQDLSKLHVTVVDLIVFEYTFI